MDGPISDEMLKKLRPSTAGLIGLCWMNGGTRNVYNSKHPIKTVEDPQGPQDPHDGQSRVRRHHELARRQRRRQGFDQLVNAMQTGVVDGAENNEPSYESGQHYRYAKYYSRTGHLIIPRAPRLLEEVVGRPVQGRSSAGREVRQRSAAGAAHALVRAREDLDRNPEKGWHRDQRGGRQEAVPGRRQAGVGQVRRPARGTDPAHPGREVRLAAI